MQSVSLSKQIKDSFDEKFIQSIADEITRKVMDRMFQGYKDNNNNNDDLSE